MTLISCTTIYNMHYTYRYLRESVVTKVLLQGVKMAQHSKDKVQSQNSATYCQVNTSSYSILIIFNFIRANHHPSPIISQVKFWFTTMILFNFIISFWFSNMMSVPSDSVPIPYNAAYVLHVLLLDVGNWMLIQGFTVSHSLWQREQNQRGLRKWGRGQGQGGEGGMD